MHLLKQSKKSKCFSPFKPNQGGNRDAKGDIEINGALEANDIDEITGSHQANGHTVNRQNTNADHPAAHVFFKLAHQNNRHRDHAKGMNNAHHKQRDEAIEFVAHRREDGQHDVP